MKKDIVLGGAAAAVLGWLMFQDAAHGSLIGVAFDVISVVVVWAVVRGRINRRRANAVLDAAAQRRAARSLRFQASATAAYKSLADDSVILSPGRHLIDPEEAEALGLTADARRLRDEEGDA